MVELHSSRLRKLDLVAVWPDVVRGIFRAKTEIPSLIVLLPEEGRTVGSDFPALIVPAGPSGFDRFTPLAFLPNDTSPPDTPMPGPAAPGGSEISDDVYEDNPAEEAEEPETDDVNLGSPFDDWPPVNPMPPPPLWPPDVPSEGPTYDSLTEEEVDEMLDDALHRVYGDEEPPAEEEEVEEDHPLEDRFWTPVIPPNLPSWWDPLEVPDVSPQPDDGPTLDLRLPRWKDLEPDMLRPPFWPPGEPWPPDDGLRLPEPWRPDEAGFHLGDWRIYIVPFSGDGN